MIKFTSAQPINSSTIRQLKQYLLLFFLLLHSIPGSGQPYWENYELLTTRQGLPHNIVLSLLQDSEGYLWIGTYNGLCRYDGHSIETYKNVFGPTHSNNWFHAIEVIYEDRDSNIWIGSRGGMVSCFERHNQRFRPYIQATGTNRVVAFYHDNTGRIWVGHNNGMLGVVKGNSIIYRPPLGSELMTIAGHKNNMPLLVTNSGIFSIDSVQGLKQHPIARFSKTDYVYSAVCAGEKLMLYTSQGLLITNTANLEMQTELKPVPYYLNIHLEFTPVAQGYLVADCFRLRMYDNNGRYTDSLNISPATWNNNHEIHNCLIKDKSGIIWLGTNSGLYKIDTRRYVFKKYAHNNTEYPLGDNYIRALYAHGKDLWTGTKLGCINRLEYDEQQQRYLYKKQYPISPAPKSGMKKDNFTINTLIQYGTAILAAGDGYNIYIKKENSDLFVPFYEVTKDMGRYGVWSLYTDAAGNIWIGTNRDGMTVWDAKKHRQYKYSPMGKGNRRIPAQSVWNIYQDKNKVLWLGTDSGLFRVRNPDNIEALQLERYPLKVADNQQINVWNFAEDKYGNLWLGTTGHGLFQITAGRDKYISYGTRPTNVISGLVTDTLGNLWISSVNGLFRYDIAAMQFTAYDEQDGLLSNEFNFKSVTATPYGTLFFGNKSGLLNFAPQDVQQHQADNVPVRISSLSIAGKDTPSAIYARSPVTLRYNQNFISIGFSILNFSKPLNHRYRYRLSGFDKQWNDAAAGQPTAAYTNLPPGSYRFEVYGTTDELHWSKSPAVFAFTINPAFWQTLAFRIGILLAALLLGAWLVYGRIKTVVTREREKHRVEKQIASLELRALQAQMNPHFIFNAINSIQHFVVHHDVLSANDYLSRFARLMRLFLESSKKRYIPLHQELELLHLYLQLEQLRFDDRFSYEIIVDASLDTQQINIPPALVQLFAENAINHGLVHLPDKGILRILFSPAGNDKIKCVIDDNGIGRERAAAIKAAHKKTHVSRGMQLIEERIKTYNFIDAQDIQIDITDKKFPEHGTIVEITATIIKNTVSP